MSDGRDRLIAGLSTAVLRERLHPRVAARIFNEPLIIHPEKALVILSAVGPRFGLVGVQLGDPMPMPMPRQDRSRDYQIMHGVAVVPAMGTIVKRNEGGMLAESGMTGTEALIQTVAAAKADPAVKAVLLQVDSYGGEALGTPDAARALVAMRSTVLGDGKPLWAIADDSAYSAGYYLAAAAERLFVTSIGGVGSIGVISFHIDESQALADAGLKITPIFAGAQKVDGWEFLPLSERAQARMQARVNGIWDTFTADVAAMRGLSQQTVKGFQAGTFYGADAVKAGLVDAVATFDEVMAELSTKVAPGMARPGGTRMDKKPEEAPAAAAPPGAADQPKPVSNVIEMTKHLADTEIAKAEARKAEKVRQDRIRGLAAISKLPRKEADALVKSLIDEDATIELAHDAFVRATAKAESLAAKGVELGIGADDGSTTMAIPAPVLRPREEILVARQHTMHTARFGGRDGFDRLVAKLKEAVA